MNKQLVKKVKLPKEESNGNENKGRDPKEESSSTPDREEDKTPNTLHDPEKVFSLMREKKQSVGCRKRLTSTKGKYSWPKK